MEDVADQIFDRGNGAWELDLHFIEDNDNKTGKEEESVE
jgi:hypothetical protein